MELRAFETLKNDFKKADTEMKIDLYLEAEDLTQLQYKELLQMFPLNELDKLEAALA